MFKKSLVEIYKAADCRQKAFYFIVFAVFSIISALVVMPIPEIGQFKNEKLLVKE